MPQETSILIIDDDEEFCQTLTDIFRERGFSTESAGTGKEALEKLKQRPFNIVLVDIKLPDADGIELFRTMKQITPEIEGIMITGYASLESAMAALRYGAFDYVIKPMVIEEVIASINDAVQRQRLSLEERQRLDREIREKEFYRSLSIVDGLTGLYNHRHFQTLLAQEMNRSRRYSHSLSLMMVDMDNFKRYQDAHGHIAGDEALIRIAQTIYRAVRGADAVARYGGEEFTVITPETSKEAATIVAERIRKAVARTKLSPGEYLTASIGIASYPSDAQDEGQLISRADQALYQAKRAGRNQVKVWGQ